MMASILHYSLKDSVKVRQRNFFILPLKTWIVAVSIALVDGSSRDPGKTVLSEQGLQDPPALIGAFNIQILGDKKMDKDNVVNILLQILPRYDLVLIQEIRDSDGDAFPELVDRLNAQTNDAYEFEMSERLGRSNIKENYAYLFRKDKFSVEVTYQYADPDDKYERPPYGAVFTSSQTAIGKFGVLGCHTKPSDAVSELDKFVDVYDEFKSQTGVEDVIMMGDFNADCSYVTGSKWSSISLYTDPRFTWLLKNEADTTVARSSCAYDRFVVAGSRMGRAIVPQSPGWYRFDTDLGLDANTTKAVSDHYPIELELYGKVADNVKQSVSMAQSFMTTGVTDLSLNAINRLLTDADLGELTMEKMKIGRKYSLITLFADYLSPENVKTILENFKNYFPTAMPAEVLYSAETFFRDIGILDNPPSFPGIVDEVAEQYYSVRIEYENDTVYLNIYRNFHQPTQTEQ